MTDKLDYSALERGRDCNYWEYDLVLHWIAFGYFDDDVNEAVAEHLRARVAANGALVIGLDNGLAELMNIQDTNASFRGDVLKVERAEYHPESARVEVRIGKFRETKDGYEFIGEVPWNIRLYSPVEIRRLLERQRHDPDGDSERDAECADEDNRITPDGAAATCSVTTHGRRCRRRTDIPAGVAPDRPTTDIVIWVPESYERCCVFTGLRADTVANSPKQANFKDAH